jgi:hypothetical protein
VNLHALVATGLIVLWITVIAKAASLLFVQRRRATTASARPARYCAVMLARYLIKSYGFSYWECRRPINAGNMARSIEEWLPFWQPPVMTINGIYIYPVVEAVLFGAGLVIWLTNPQRRWAHLAGYYRCDDFRALAADVVDFRDFIFNRDGCQLQYARFKHVVALVAAHDTRQHARTDSHWSAFTGTPWHDSGLVVWLLAAASRHNEREAGVWNVPVRNVPEGAARQILSGRLPRAFQRLRRFQLFAMATQRL